VLCIAYDAVRSSPSVFEFCQPQVLDKKYIRDVCGLGIHFESNTRPKEEGREQKAE
jgi:hypothetical protein